MVNIREASPADAEQIMAFQMSMAKETEGLILDENLVRPGVQAVFGDSSKGKYYVAESEGQVIGSLLTTYEWSDWRNGTVLWIQSVFISKKYRGVGIYKKMYTYIQAMVLNNQKEYKGIRLYVDKTNQPAQAVYEKLGMINHHYDMYEWMPE